MDLTTLQSSRNTNSESNNVKKVTMVIAMVIACHYCNDM